MSISRRSFIKQSAAGAAGLTLAGSAVNAIEARTLKTAAWTDKMPINPDISNMRVVCCLDPLMCPKSPTSMSKFSTVNDAVDSEKVAVNMDRMAMELAQKTTPADAWKTIFRSGKPWNETKVAIKINGVMNNLARVAIVKKIADVMVDLGVQPANIVVYDGHGDASGSGKYTPYGSLTDPSKIRAVISEKFKSMSGAKAITIPDIGSGVGPKDLVDGVTDILVNIAVNKGHLTQAGTTTLCLKAHFGTFINKEGGDAIFMHAKLSDAIININKMDPIVGGTPVRQQLCIIDSILASQGGPSGNADAKLDRIIMGTFAGAVDYCCVKKVREGVKNWKHDSAVVKRFLTDFGYAETDPQWVELTPTGATTEKVNHPAASKKVSFTMSNTSLRQSTIRFSIPSGTHEPLRTRIFDMRGSLVVEMQSPAGATAINWDGKATNGSRIGVGSYVVHVSSGNFNAAERLTVIQS